MRAVVLLWAAMACTSPPEGTSSPASGLAFGEVSPPMPGVGAQHHATLACTQTTCVMARQVGPSVRFTEVDPEGQPLVQVRAPVPPTQWNHPEVAVYGDGWWVVSAVAGAPVGMRLDASMQPPVDATALHDPWPWGLWPDFAIGDDQRALVVWSTKVAGLWRLVDPARPGEGTGQPWELSLPTATVDPPAVIAVPDGYVRAWTEKNGFAWHLVLQWTDLDGEPLGPPVVAATGDGTSRGARPQLAADDLGNVAVAWRVWPALDAAPEGAFLRIYDAAGHPRSDPHRLDPDDRGNRPSLSHTPDGWLVAWEQGTPSTIHTQLRGPTGAPITTASVTASHPTFSVGRAALAVRPEGDRWAALISWEIVRAKQGDAITSASVRARAIRPANTPTLSGVTGSTP